MGNPSSPILANIVMNHILKRVMEILPFPVPFLKLYVDDTITAIPKDKVSTVLDIFNSINKKIQFTMEMEKNNQLPFLDVMIIRKDDNSILTSWYVKPTSSGRCLNYYSNHPLSQKISIIKGFMFRSLSLSSEQFHIENLGKVEKLLKNNNYPTGLIHTIFKNYKRDKTIQDNKLEIKKFIRFSFINTISNQINKCFNKTNIKLVFNNLVKLSSIYTKLKDKVDKWEQSQVIYKIPCVWKILHRTN
ncbi:GSCOCG00010569001-RA-CDS [Cotesia congregata]|nr:GSCOCG00010569001-RA-CDS [Cotesia congregata]